MMFGPPRQLLFMFAASCSAVVSRHYADKWGRKVIEYYRTPPAVNTDNPEVN